MCDNQEFGVSKEQNQKNVKYLSSLIKCLIITVMFLIIPIYLKLLGIF